MPLPPRGGGGSATTRRGGLDRRSQLDCGPAEPRRHSDDARTRPGQVRGNRPPGRSGRCGRAVVSSSNPPPGRGRPTSPAPGEGPLMPHHASLPESTKCCEAQVRVGSSNAPPPARGRWVGHDPVGGFGQTFTGWTADQPNLADTPTMLERALVRFVATDVLVDLDAVVKRLSLLLTP